MKRTIISSLICILFIASCSKKEDFLEDNTSILNIYPNPIIEGGVVHIYGNGSLSGTIRITNKFGEEFYSSDQDINGYFQRNINLADLPPNIYFFDYETSNGLLRKELIILEGPF